MPSPRQKIAAALLLSILSLAGCQKQQSESPKEQNQGANFLAENAKKPGITTTATPIGLID